MTTSRLGKKYKLSKPAVLRRFKKDETFANDTGTVKLIKPDSYTAKKRLVKTWHNPYIGTVKIEREVHFSYDQLWDGCGKDWNWQDIREHVILLKGTICAIQGQNCISQGKPLHPSEIEIDHI